MFENLENQTPQKENQETSKSKLLKEVLTCWETRPGMKFGYLVASIVKSGKKQLEISDEEFIKLCEEFRIDLP